MNNHLRFGTILCLLLILPCLLLTGCDGNGASSSIPEMSVRSSALPEVPTSTTQSYSSSGNSLSFECPGDWTVEESGHIILLSSPPAMDSAILIADISYEVSLFLAGHGDMEGSIDALIDKYADSVSGESPRENYKYSWNQDGSGDIRANATFTYQGGASSFEGFVDVEQIGSRVFISICISPNDNRRTETSAIYDALNKSFSASGTQGVLEPADLSDLGFPEAPSGFERFYSPVTGQFFIYPDDWNLVSNAHEDSVILFNEKGALMLTENWTDSFYELYNSNGNDEVECFDKFLDECAGALETIYGETPRYHDFQYMATKNQELIKATFNYTVGQGTGRCFAEFGVRPMNGKDYIQATLCLYKVGDSYSIDMFSVIMDSTVILYPEL